MKLPDDYRERVYAGVLGKIIGVYLGRPFEGWSHQRITRELGDITGYVHDRLGQPLVVTDDDITGTFTFLRALPDNANRPDLSAREIGQAWLNYIIVGKTILWWGGMGESTEHTAFLRLKDGVQAPRSGSRELNGRIVSEQIGAEIFADGWALVSPGDPELAARLAGEAARVSHDGEAVYAAQVIAAMEAAAFTESDMNRLIDSALRLIPADSTITRVTAEVREWCARDTEWRTTRALIEEKHGYARYGGHVPVVSNFAVVLMALVLGEGDLQKSLMIANTSGWDTDCNSGNVGCLLGIKNGLSVFEGQQDWRGPVADRMFMPTADGGRAITDAVTETIHIVAIGRSLAGEGPAPAPKGGARFHFELPGSVQGFTIDDGAVARIQNVEGHSREGTRSLAVRFDRLEQGLRVTTPVFIPPDALVMKEYQLLASPLLYSGQIMSVRVEADKGSTAPVSVSAIAKLYGPKDAQQRISSPAQVVQPGGSAVIRWTLPDTEGQPIFAAGIELTPAAGLGAGLGAGRDASRDAGQGGIVYIDYLGWTGTPRAAFKKPIGGGELWRRAWVNAFDHHGVIWPEAFRLSQDHGTGLHITGAHDWRDYRVSSVIASDMAVDIGLAVRVQGLQRYYALVVTSAGKTELRKVFRGTRVLGTAPCEWKEGVGRSFSIDVQGARITARIDEKVIFDVVDDDEPLDAGGIALVCTQGCISANEVRVEPLESR
ncbi:MAG: ADP-ribosylglycohydrolase family protein [Spirochaetia bacterium]